MSHRTRARRHRGGYLWLTAAILLATTRPGTADGVATTESFVEAGRPGSHPGTVGSEGPGIRVDLEAVPPDARVLRAVLHLQREPGATRGGSPSLLEPVRVVALPRDDGGESTLLELRPPRYRSFDATSVVRARLEARDPTSRPQVRFRVERLSGWKRGGARLDVTFERDASEARTPRLEPPAGARDLRAWHIDGRTFLAWSQPDHGLPQPDATVEDLRRAMEEDGRDHEIRYRI